MHARVQERPLGTKSFPRVGGASLLSFFFFFINLFMYLFLAVLGLRFCVRAFSSCGERGPLFSAVPLFSAGLSLSRPLPLRSTGSRRADSVAVAHGLKLLRGMWDLPRPGLEPVCPALASGFLTTAPPGKPPSCLFKETEVSPESDSLAGGGVCSVIPAHSSGGVKRSRPARRLPVLPLHSLVAITDNGQCDWEVAVGELCQAVSIKAGQEEGARPQVDQSPPKTKTTPYRYAAEKEKEVCLLRMELD